ncbi:hypothetical protein F4778DRAFT_629790 [Xylariomycetidae sp. FL2044]|nr:hypothetical protein F4778DRAFT_629726 [Xylariomycetidae sp. FL2044]KAH9883593.1 hypothetical protein F4778DRAFT_629790 [Xylariomycetidae sp. FL2044]
MSTVRLNFLYPHLFRAARFRKAAGYATKVHRRDPPSQADPNVSSFSTSSCAKEAVFERHGKAVEPLSVPPNVVKLPPPDTDASQASPPSRPQTQPDADTKPGRTGEKVNDHESREIPKPGKPTEESTSPPLGQPRKPANPQPTGSTPHQAATDARMQQMQQSGPMDAVLHMPPPEATSHPHISKPPYVHHFDSYTLVKQLETGGYSKAQAITVMKAVRALLAQNLDVAQDGLVSKSDVDNETYLFRAACSELSAEVKNNRKTADEQMRQQRTQLQHEVDIVGQRMSQDLMTLKDDVKGMFNDRRMNVREEQRTMESAIQQVNLKISVTLNSDSRSDIEGLRWVLIRRSVLGIIFMAVLALGTIRYTTYLSHEKQREVEEKARYMETLKNNGGREDHAPPVEAAEILAAN